MEDWGRELLGIFDIVGMFDGRRIFGGGGERAEEREGGYTGAVSGTEAEHFR